MASEPTTIHVTPRPAVKRFARRMEGVLRENDYKGGWGECSDDYLLGRLVGEVAEVVKEYARGPRAWLAVRILRTIASDIADGEQFVQPPRDEYHVDDRVHELVDVANFAMMLAEMPAEMLGGDDDGE